MSIKLKHPFLLLISLISPLFLISCDSDSRPAPAPEEEVKKYTHAELAVEFVLRMNSDLGIDLSLLKTDTLQYDYIVVENLDLYDPIAGPHYTAYYIGDYNVGEDLAAYLNHYEDDFHDPLVDNFDGTFSGFDGFGNYASF